MRKPPEPKRYRVEKLTDLFEIPEDRMDDFLVDLKAWHSLAQSVPKLLDAVGEASGVKLKATRPTFMTWVDDGRHDARVHIKPVIKEAIHD